MSAAITAKSCHPSQGGLAVARLEAATASHGLAAWSRGKIRNRPARLECTVTMPLEQMTPMEKVLLQTHFLMLRKCWPRVARPRKRDNEKQLLLLR